VTTNVKGIVSLLSLIVQQQLVKECAAEICKLKKIKFSDPKNITEIMKKYEDK